MRPVIATVGPLAASTGSIATLGSITGGTGYTTGSYTAVALTGGTGSGATANITVSGGAVTVVTLVNHGTGYTVGDTLSAAAANIGGTGSGFSVPVATISTDSIAQSQTPVAAGALTLNGTSVIGGIAYLDHARRVLITTADTTHVFTVTGTTPTGAVITETVGPITTSAYTAQDFATITSVTINGAATAAVTVGTNGIASTPWVRLDEWASPDVSIQCDVSGTVNYTVQATNDDPNSPTNAVLPQNVTWVNSPDTNAVAATTAQRTGYGPLLAYGALLPIFVRVTLNSGTGSVTATVVQRGAVPY